MSVGQEIESLFEFQLFLDDFMLSERSSSNEKSPRNSSKKIQFATNEKRFLNLFPNSELLEGVDRCASVDDDMLSLTTANSLPNESPSKGFRTKTTVSVSSDEGSGSSYTSLTSITSEELEDALGNSYCSQFHSHLFRLLTKI